MDEKFYQSIISGIQEMEALKDDYEKKQAPGVVLEVSII